MIKDIRPDERPDEKFLKFGAKALSDSELLAIILRTGSREENSAELAGKILGPSLGEDENILRIFDLEIEDLMKIKGIGRVKSLQIKAVAELSGRIFSATKKNNFMFNDPAVVAAHYMERLRHLKKEVVLLLMLSSSCALIKDTIISEGTVNASLFSPREVYLEALRCEAVNIILLHNHPSGSPEPSKADIDATKQVYEAGKVIGISLLDHIVIGDNVYVSMRERGLLK